jgi:hypothetical protein
VKVQFVVPAGNGQLEKIINELEYICDSIGLRVALVFFLHDMIIIAFLLLDNIYNEFLEFAVESSDVYFTELFLSFIYLFVFDYVSIHETLVS